MFLNKIKNVQTKKIGIAGRTVNCTIAHSRRKTLMMRVSLKGEVEIKAPLRASEKAINKFITDRHDWIAGVLEKFDSNISIKAPKDFKTGEKIWFLGQQYEIEVRQDLTRKVFLDNNKLVVTFPSLRATTGSVAIQPDDWIASSATPPRNDDIIKTMIVKWYKQQLEKIFAERLAECLKAAANIGITKAKPVKIRKMERRWGTCTHDNQILVNSSLIFLEERYMDYLLCHELCHFIEKNHSPKYYTLLKSVCPDYKQVRDKLNRHVIENFL